MNIASSLLRTLVIALLVLLRPATCIADPIAIWLGPWAPTFDPIQTSAGLGADASAIRSFGP
jgi:hypothetical protein